MPTAKTTIHPLKRSVNGALAMALVVIYSVVQAIHTGG